MIEISVIIPAYREEKVIGGVVEKVRRVMEATGKTHEILVVDDGSDDETAAAARNVGANVISHPYNIGNGAAVKTGIRHAQGAILQDRHPPRAGRHPRHDGRRRPAQPGRHHAITRKD
jgi:glycosyltransferase involved in cell wall biosynthesis